MEVLEYCPESTRVLPREYSSTFAEVLELPYAHRFSIPIVAGNSREKERMGK